MMKGCICNVCSKSEEYMSSKVSDVRCVGKSEKSNCEISYKSVGENCICST